jgi:hypothetical protein
MTNKLFYGDNRDVLREHIASESVYLVYFDDLGLICAGDTR